MKPGNSGESRKLETSKLLSRVYTKAASATFLPVGMTRALLMREFDEFWDEAETEDGGLREMYPSRIAYVLLHCMLARHFPNCAIDPIIRALFDLELKDELPDGGNMPLNHQTWSTLLKERREKKENQEKPELQGSAKMKEEGGGTDDKKAVKQEVKQEEGEDGRMPARKFGKLDASFLLSLSFNRALVSETPPLGMTELLLTREFFEFWEANPPPDHEMEGMSRSYFVYVFLLDMISRHFPESAIDPIIESLFIQELQEGAPGTSETPLNNQAWINQLREQKRRDSAKDAEMAVIAGSAIGSSAAEARSKQNQNSHVKQEPRHDSKGKQPMQPLQFEKVPEAVRHPAPTSAGSKAPRSGMGWRPSFLATMSASRTSRPNRPRRAPTTHMALRSSLAQQLVFKDPREKQEAPAKRAKK
mmetsp:Transcript_9273/g.18534  ORF Transcript_9273/g.18534 Transcript_9273/m.18534 type:complete len:418 (-) Transcript_9273:140-1393(-)